MDENDFFTKKSSSSQSTHFVDTHPRAMRRASYMNVHPEKKLFFFGAEIVDWIGFE